MLQLTNDQIFKHLSDAGYNPNKVKSVEKTLFSLQFDPSDISQTIFDNSIVNCQKLLFLSNDEILNYMNKISKSNALYVGEISVNNIISDSFLPLVATVDIKKNSYQRNADRKYVYNKMFDVFSHIMPTFCPDKNYAPSTFPADDRFDILISSNIVNISPSLGHRLNHFFFTDLKNYHARFDKDSMTIDFSQIPIKVDFNAVLEFNLGRTSILHYSYILQISRKNNVYSYSHYQIPSNYMASYCAINTGSLYTVSFDGYKVYI